MTWLMVLVGAMIGAPLRFGVSHALRHRDHGIGPWGTWVVNAAGSALLGALLGISHSRGLSPEAMALLGTGFCGALTTWSTCAWETIRLAELRSWAAATLNIGANISVGILMAWAGWHLTT